jgi:hypothetical protein
MAAHLAAFAMPYPPAFSPTVAAAFGSAGREAKFSAI